MKFEIGSKVVYGSHGVVEVKKIEFKGIGGLRKEYYVLWKEASNLTIILPMGSELISPLPDEFTKTKAKIILKNYKGSYTQATWNVRYRESVERIKRGNVCDIARVLAELNCLSKTKDLSFGEIKLRDAAIELLTELGVL
jgi:CarD family transcriptional regulator